MPEFSFVYRGSTHVMLVTYFVKPKLHGNSFLIASSQHPRGHARHPRIVTSMLRVSDRRTDGRHARRKVRPAYEPIYMQLEWVKAADAEKRGGDVTARADISTAFNLMMACKLED